MGESWAGAEGGKPSAPVGRFGKDWVDAEIGVSASVGRVGGDGPGTEIGVSVPVGSAGMIITMLLSVKT